MSISVSFHLVLITLETVCIRTQEDKGSDKNMPGLLSVIVVIKLLIFNKKARKHLHARPTTLNVCSVAECCRINAIFFVSTLSLCWNIA